MGIIDIIKECLSKVYFICISFEILNYMKQENVSNKFANYEITIEFLVNMFL